MTMCISSVNSLSSNLKSMEDPLYPQDDHQDHSSAALSMGDLDVDGDEDDGFDYYLQLDSSKNNKNSDEDMISPPSVEKRKLNSDAPLSSSERMDRRRSQITLASDGGFSLSSLEIDLGSDVDDDEEEDDDEEPRLSYERFMSTRRRDSVDFLPPLPPCSSERFRPVASSPAQRKQIRSSPYHWRTEKPIKESSAVGEASVAEDCSEIKAITRSLSETFRESRWSSIPDMALISANDSRTLSSQKDSCNSPSIPSRTKDPFDLLGSAPLPRRCNSFESVESYMEHHRRLETLKAIQSSSRRRMSDTTERPPRSSSMLNHDLRWSHHGHTGSPPQDTSLRFPQRH